MTGNARLQVLTTLSNPHRMRVIGVLAEERSYVSRLARYLCSGSLISNATGRSSGRGSSDA
jgi:hypothetical protein